MMEAGAITLRQSNAECWAPSSLASEPGEAGVPGTTGGEAAVATGVRGLELPCVREVCKPEERDKPAPKPANSAVPSEAQARRVGAAAGVKSSGGAELPEEEDDVSDDWDEQDAPPSALRLAARAAAKPILSNRASGSKVDEGKGEMVVAVVVVARTNGLLVADVARRRQC